MKRISPGSTKPKPKSVSVKSQSTFSKSASRKPPKPSSKKVTSTPIKPAALDCSRSKQSQLIAALRGATGASMAALTSLTGWQPHTVRGTISGSLRKRLGLNVQCVVEEGVRVYRIVESSAK